MKKTGKSAIKAASKTAGKAVVRRRPAAATDVVVVEGFGDERRDRMKNYYFMDSLNNTTIDPELKEMWEKVKGNRKKETMLINGVMTKQLNGKFKADKNSPGYKELHAMISSTYWRDEEKGIPRSLAIIKFKGAENLDRAVASGDVRGAEDQGQVFYSWRNIVVGTAGRSEHTAQLQKTGQIDDNSYERLAGMLTKVGWSFKFTKRQQELTVLGKELPAEAVEKMNSASVALGKVSKQAVTMLQNMKGPQYFQNTYVQQAKEKLSEFLVQIRQSENILEGLLVVGKDSDGKPATCEGVLKVLGKSAQVLENSMEHLKLVAGLLKGSKAA